MLAATDRGASAIDDLTSVLTSGATKVSLAGAAVLAEVEDAGGAARDAGAGGGAAGAAAGAGGVELAASDGALAPRRRLNMVGYGLQDITTSREDRIDRMIDSSIHFPCRRQEDDTVGIFCAFS